MNFLKYPIGIQTFEKIRTEGYIYVDKTKYVYDLVAKGQYYFLSRPRRFGKSLLLSTLEAFFRGRKELFKGLYAYDQKWDWAEYPVFHLALNGQDYDSVEKLDETLNYFMDEWEKAYNVPVESSIATVAVRFTNCIRRASEAMGKGVVILIDEYDQPLLHNIERGKEDLHNRLREHLQAFFSVMKAQDKYIRFAILTGISKFSKVSVFSGLNNLNDISFDKETNAICGICESELDEVFEESIRQMAEANEMTVKETKTRLKTEYDGYHFCRNGQGVYNPFSLLNAFNKNEFRRYWVASGTPSFLIKLLENRNCDLSRISGSTVTESDIMGSDLYITNPIPMLLQSGYLTIKGFDPRFKEYYLDYPNKEVAEGFNNDLLKAYSCKKDADVLIKDFIRYVERGEPEKFMKSLQSLLADIPYDQILNKELHYENMMFLVMKLMGFYTHTEYKTANGRIDMVVKTDRYAYIMEFKLHGTPREALDQIKQKEYAKPFANDARETILIGAAFSDEKRNLESWLIETI
ncbi:MAG: ATP-binding protein [Lachnospiraceae bacterium]|nr:ATP-binding protein [Lachnospiraceae bacterium]